MSILILCNAVAVEKEIQVILLSIIYPANDPQLSRELLRLRDLLPEKSHVIVGGRAAGSYGKTLDRINAKYYTDLSKLREYLQSIIIP